MKSLKWIAAIYLAVFLFAMGEYLTGSCDIEGLMIIVVAVSLPTSIYVQVGFQVFANKMGHVAGPVFFGVLLCLFHLSIVFFAFKGIGLIRRRIRAS